MKEISRLTQNGVEFEFHPPIQVPDDAIVSTLGAVVYWVTPSLRKGLISEVGGLLKDSVIRDIDGRIGTSSDSKAILNNIRGPLKAAGHTVRIV